jgi:large subunit ribosomal protein L18
MSLLSKKKLQRARRASRVHAKVRAHAHRPRLSVFRSLKHFYVQLIDDVNGKTLCACSTLELAGLSGDKKEQAKAVGLEIAKRAKEHHVDAVVFDRGRFLYHGRLHMFAEGAREGGLKF